MLSLDRMLLSLTAFLLTSAAPVVAPPPSRCSYRPHLLHELFALADTAVQGRIQALDEDTITLHVERSVVGASASGDAQRLPRFKNWMCSGRPVEYALDQELFLFVREGHVMGWGDEGELFVGPAGVLVLWCVADARYAERRIDGRSVCGSWMTTNALCDASIDASRA